MSFGSASTVDTEKEVEEPEDTIVAQELAEICNNTIRFEDECAVASNSLYSCDNIIKRLVIEGNSFNYK